MLKNVRGNLLTFGMTMLQRLIDNSRLEQAAEEEAARGFAVAFLTGPSAGFWDQSCWCPANCPIVDRVSRVQYGGPNCGVGYEVNGFVGPDPAIGSGNQSVLYGYRKVSVLTSPPYAPEAAGIGIWETSVVFNKKPGSPLEVPYSQPWAIPATQPGTNPGPLPVAWPIVDPAPAVSTAPDPEPEVEALQDPAKQPEKQPDRNNRPDYSIPPLRVPIVIFDGSPGWQNVVNVRPFDQIFDVGEAPRTNLDIAVAVRSRPSTASSKRPPRRVNQKKATIQTVAGAGVAVVNTITEGVDFLKAMHKAIPEERRKTAYNWYGTGSDRKKKKRELTPQEMAADLAKNWKYFQFAEAFENYINMQMSDYVAAMGSNATKKLSQDLGVATGVDRAISRTQQRFQDGEAAAAEAMEQGYVPQGGLAPRVDINLADGYVSVSAPALGWSYMLGW